jgi:hypothetical protein
VPKRDCQYPQIILLLQVSKREPAKSHSHPSAPGSGGKGGRGLGCSKWEIQVEACLGFCTGESLMLLGSSGHLQREANPGFQVPYNGAGSIFFKAASNLKTNKQTKKTPVVFTFTSEALQLLFF